MRIRFAPRRGTVEVELRDILGGNPLAKWYVADEREIPDGTKVVWADGSSPATQMDAATAIFRHGPDFVDAATGKNPLYSCADCGGEALEEHAYDYDRDKPIPFVNDDGKRLCSACWLGGHHAELIPKFEHAYQYPKDVIERAKAIAGKSASFARAPVASATEEEN